MITPVLKVNRFMARERRHGKAKRRDCARDRHRKLSEPESRFRSRREGDAVAVNYASDRTGAGRAVEKIRTAGGKVISITQFTSSVEIDRYVGETEATWSR
jgi:hypothetical protein